MVFPPVRGAPRVVAAWILTGSLAASCSGATSRSASGSTGSGAPSRHVAPGPGDWPTYGHDARHTFHGSTTITPSEAPTLSTAWFFPTGDAVTATPTVVADTVYVGSWDGFFYALDLATGGLRWKFRLHPQNAVTPYPGQNPRDATSDGGLVTSSAWYERGSGNRPDLVIFGGGYTLYALDAHTGHLYWSHAYTGRPDRPPDPAHDDSRIFSSPVVADGRVFFAVDADGSKGYRGYLVAADVRNGRPDWQVQLDVDTHGRVVNDGCGNIWSSGTILADRGLVVFDTSDCKFSNPPPLNESVVAFSMGNGRIVWKFTPSRADTKCDFDFGASVNAGVDAHGRTDFLGVGSKDGTYYSLDPATGRLFWETNVVFGGFAGGFIGSTAYDGHRVYGATAYGDFGRFEGPGMAHCQPGNPKDTELQEPSVHAFDAATGHVAWEASGSVSVAPTTVAGGMTFTGLATGNVLSVRSSATGSSIAQVHLPQACWSGVATVGDAIVLGLGSSYVGTGSGIEVLTPGGRAPSIAR